MNQFLAPLVVRLAILFASGLITAGFINLAVYRLAWRQRSISPWSQPPHGLTRAWSDRLPLWGWWRLRREAHVHGRGFWIRPLIVELLTALLFVGLYMWEVEQTALYAPVMPGAAPPGALVTTEFETVVHAQFLAHALLLSLMLAASLIDLDEQTIPDGITVCGALAGLMLVTCYPWALLPAETWVVNRQRAVEFLSLVSPNGWPPDLGGLPLVEPLLWALGAWTLWCGGLLERRVRLRHGWLRAIQYFVYRLWVDPRSWWTLGLWAAGAVGISLVAARAPEANWAALFTGLVGLAAGGGVIWTVRVVGSAALGKEAMGFGDVTLMAMIGVFIGWQGALLAFFVAPLAGLLIAVVRWVQSGDNVIPFGPFLCVAAAIVIVHWAGFWQWGAGIFELGWIVPAMLGAALALMGVLLMIYRMVGDWWLRE